jgi:hypothetical protein
MVVGVKSKYFILAFLLVTTCLVAVPRTVFAGCTAGRTVCSCANPGCCWCSQTSGACEACRGGCSGSCSSAEDSRQEVTDFDCTPPDCCCGSGGCFTSDTEIKTPDGNKNIKDLVEGDEVMSFNEDTVAGSTSVVNQIFQLEREGYYLVKLADGTELKVTGEHPLYSAKKEDVPLTFWQYLKNESLSKKTFDFITSLFEE